MTTRHPGANPGANPVRRLDSYEDLLEASGHHPVVELDVGRGLVPPAWAARTSTGSAVAFPRRSDHGVPGASVLGDPDAVAALLRDARVRAWFVGGDLHHLGRPRELDPLVEDLLPLGEEYGDWEWMWTKEAPVRLPAERHVVSLSPTDRDELLALLAVASPRTHGQPYARPRQWWVGVRDDAGRLVACGGAEPSGAGTPTLTGIAVAPDRRGEGLGAAVTAVLTRRALDATGACALGMFSDNDAARRLYHRLGYRTEVAWRSRWPAAATSTPTC